MKIHELIEQSYQNFWDQAADAKVVLLHPQSMYRSVLVAKLINAPETSAFYYALGPDDINLESFLSGITHDLANQHATFGRHINILPHTERQKFDSALNAFAADIAELSDDPFMLILDEYDRSDSADDIQVFVERLAGRLPTHCKLVINSRSLPRLPWVSLIAQKKAVMLQDDRLINSDFYDLATTGENRLEVLALGPGYMLMNGETIENWEGHLPRLLFFFALDRPSITRSEICQAFWPELETDQAVNVFHVTKRRLHKALDLDVLVHDEGYYRVNPLLAIQYDVMDFVTALMAGRNPENTKPLEAWSRAVELYRGPFLQGHSDAWIIERRKDFQAGYLEALTEIAHIRLQEDRPEHALALFQKALNEDNSREPIHREVMRLYARLGRRSEAAAHYQRLAEDFDKEGLTLSTETDDLYGEIMA